MGGSSKKQTTGYKYYMGMHMILCHGPADALLRIRVDEAEAWAGNQVGSGQITIAKDKLFGGDSREGGISGKIDVEMGGPAQGQNSYLAEKIDVGVPNFRGVVGLVLRHMYFGMSPYLKKWDFRLSRIHLRQNGIAQWYDAKASIGRAVSTLPGSDTPGQWYVPAGATYRNAATVYGTVAVGYYGTAAEIGANAIAARNAATGSTYTCTGTLYGTYGGDTQIVGWDASLGAGVGIAACLGVIAECPAGYTPEVIENAPDSSGGVDNPSVVCHLDSVTVYHYDMNPAHIIRECLTDPDWGMGYLEADIDDVTFAAVADQLHIEGMGISLVWDRQASIESFIQEIIKHIDATLYVSRSTGKFVLKLIRFDYDVDSLLLLNTGNVEKLESPSRTMFGELVNSVTVNYWDSVTGNDASVTVQDTAMIQMQGAVINTTIQYPGFTNFALASRIAQRDLLSLSSALLTCTLYANQDAKDLNIGDVVKLTWEDFEIDELIMRVVGLAFGDGKSNKIRITATQGVFKLPVAGVVAEPGTGWVDPTQDPVPAPYRIVTEAPYHELVQRLGQTTIDANLVDNPDLGYLIASAGQVGSAINARLIIDAGAGYGGDTAIDFCPLAFLGADLSETATTVAITGGDALDQVILGSHAQIDGELVKITAISDVSMDIGRGVLDTVPAAHVSGTIVMFWDEFADSDAVEYVSTESIDAKILPVTGKGDLDPSLATADTLVFAARAIRPYPPGNFKIGGVAFPAAEYGALSVTWSHRDRLQQTSGDLVVTTDGDTGPEAGTTYNGYVYDDDTDALLTSGTGLTSPWAPVIIGSRWLRIELESERDSLMSWQRQVCVFAYTSTEPLFDESDDAILDENDLPITGE